MFAFAVESPYLWNMRKNLIAFAAAALALVSVAACTKAAVVDEILLADLKDNEALIVAIDRCHWRCTKGLIRFQGDVVSTLGHERLLTDADKRQVDANLQASVSFPELRAGAELPHIRSAPLRMRTAKMRRNRMIAITPLKLYDFSGPNAEGRTAFHLADELLSELDENPWASIKLVIDDETLSLLEEEQSNID